MEQESSIPEKIARMLEDLITARDAGQLNSWETEFVTNVSTFRSLTMKQQKRIGIVHAQRIGGEAVPAIRTDYLEGDIRIEKKDSGWLVYVGGEPIGSHITRKEGETIVEWMRQADAELSAVYRNGHKPIAEPPEPEPEPPEPVATTADIEEHIYMGTASPEAEPEEAPNYSGDTFEDPPF